MWVTYNLSDHTEGGPVYVMIRTLPGSEKIEILSVDGKNYMWSDSEKALTNRMLKMSANEIIPVQCDSKFTYFKDMMRYLGSLLPQVPQVPQEPNTRTTSVSTKRQYEFYQDYDVPPSPNPRKAYEYSKSTYEFVKGMIIKKTLHSTLCVSFETSEPELIYTAPNEKEAIAICTTNTDTDTGLMACVIDMHSGDIQIVNYLPTHPDSLTYNEEDGGLYMTIHSRILRCRDPFMDMGAWEEFRDSKWERIKENDFKFQDRLYNDGSRNYEIVHFGDSAND
jgi:hypothetical protein